VRAGAARRSADVVRLALAGGALLVIVLALVGLAFAGSPARIAEGVTIAGVDVGGLTRAEARRVLESRAARVARVPVVFTVGERQFPVKATSLGVEADWQSALESASEVGEGFGPVRGFRRLQTRFFARTTAIGCSSGSFRRRATTARASSSLIPPTSTPAIVTPSAMRSSRDESYA